MKKMDKESNVVTDMLKEMGYEKITKENRVKVIDFLLQKMFDLRMEQVRSMQDPMPDYITMDDVSKFYKNFGEVKEKLGVFLGILFALENMDFK